MPCYRLALATFMLCVLAISVACSEQRPSDADAVAGSGASAGAGSGAGTGNAGAGAASSGPAIPPSAGDWQSDFAEARLDVETSSDASCSVAPSDLEASALARVAHGTSAIYVGYDQVSGDNQDPVVARVDDGVLAWCVHHENDGPDGRALGITWDGGPAAYVVYTIVGGGSDLEKPGWFRSYGGHAAISGGGVKVSVLGRVDAQSGELAYATHIIAVKTDRKVNSHAPAGAARVLEDGSVEFWGESAHKPIGADGKNAMDCTDYPFESRYRFSPDLAMLECAECSNCTGNTLACP